MANPNARVQPYVQSNLPAGAAQPSRTSTAMAASSTASTRLPPRPTARSLSRSASRTRQNRRERVAPIIAHEARTDHKRITFAFAVESIKNGSTARDEDVAHEEAEIEYQRVKSNRQALFYDRALVTKAAEMGLPQSEVAQPFSSAPSGGTHNGVKLTAIEKKKQDNHASAVATRSKQNMLVKSLIGAVARREQESRVLLKAWEESQTRQMEAYEEIERLRRKNAELQARLDSATSILPNANSSQAVTPPASANLETMQQTAGAPHGTSTFQTGALFDESGIRSSSRRLSLEECVSTTCKAETTLASTSTSEIANMCENVALYDHETPLEGASALHDMASGESRTPHLPHHVPRAQLSNREDAKPDLAPMFLSMTELDDDTAGDQAFVTPHQPFLGAQDDSDVPMGSLGPSFYDDSALLAKEAAILGTLPPSASPRAAVSPNHYSSLFSLGQNTNSGFLSGSA